MLTIRPPDSYHPGRLEPVELVVLHTAQAPCAPGRAAGIMAYLARGNSGASAHWCTDPTATVAGVDEADTAWGAPGANANGIHIEQAAYAEFGRPGQPAWTDPNPRRMLVEQTVPLVASICRRHGIPPVLLEPDDLRAGRKGITDHVRVSAAFSGGDHWDCGENFPLAEVVAMVAAALDGAKPTPTGDDDMVRIIRNAKTGELFWWNGQTRAAIHPVTPGRTWDQLEASLKGIIASHPSCSVWPPAEPGGPSPLYRDLPDHDIELIPVVS